MNCQKWVCNIQTHTPAGKKHFDYCVKIKKKIKERMEYTRAPCSSCASHSLKLFVLEIPLKPSFRLCFKERRDGRKMVKLPYEKDKAVVREIGQDLED